MDLRRDLRSRQLRNARPASQLHGIHSVDHQHGDRQRAYAARNGRDRAGNFDDLGVHVTDQRRTILREGGLAFFVALEKPFEFGTVGDLVHADVDDGGSGPDIVARDHAGAADGGDQDVSSAADTREIAGLRVANRNRRVAVDQEHGGWFADNVAAPHHDSFLSRDWDIAAFQNFDDAGRSTGNKTGPLRREETNVNGVKAVHVFRGVDSHQHFLGIDLRGKRKLYQDAVNLVTGIQVMHQVEKFFGAGCRRGRVFLAVDADFLAAFDLTANIDLRRGIVAHEDHGEAGTDAGSGQVLDFCGDFCADVGSDFGAVQDGGRHEFLYCGICRDGNTIVNELMPL